MLWKEYWSVNVEEGGIGIIEMLFCTSLVAIVGCGEHPLFSPRKLQIRQSTICELSFQSKILATKLNRKRLIIVLEEHVYVYDISNMKLLHTIDTSPNPNALCCLSASNENCLLGYPSNSSGEVLIFDASTLQAVNIIQAHKSCLTCIEFNYDGTMLATASDKGTVIRVFSVPQGETLFQFRRGTYPARIYSISFLADSQYLACSSDTDTVHIYKLSVTSPQVDAPIHPFKSRISAASQVGSYLLPDIITDMWEPTRDFAYAKFNQKGQNICSLCQVQGQLHLYVVSQSGLFSIFSVPTTGGECHLVKTESILDSEED